MARAPDWLADALADNLSRLGGQQEPLAQVILDAEDPIVDEVAFVVARVFDILKPLGVRRLEKVGGGGGLGIMADDLGAGVLAAVATQITVRVLGW